MGNSIQPFANPGTWGKYPASVLCARQWKYLFIGQSRLLFVNLILRNESVVSA